MRRLARLYGGDVTVTSAPDVGSTFRVELAREPSASLLAGTVAEGGAE